MPVAHLNQEIQLLTSFIALPPSRPRGLAFVDRLHRPARLGARTLTGLVPTRTRCQSDMK